MKPRYSGNKSVKFWARIADLPEPVRWVVYRAGCALQTHEEHVLAMLLEAEALDQG
jgi:hypothetical protein